MTLLQTFLETKCEVCGLSKPKNTAFCKSCYYSLPYALRNALWSRFGEGFEEAYKSGLDWLRRKAEP